MGLFDTQNNRRTNDSLNSIQMPSLSSVPVEQVAALKQQGASDTMIIQTLQRDGYKTHQIFDAMNQADLVSGSPRGIEDLQQENMAGGPQIFVNPPAPPGQSTQQMMPSPPGMMSSMPQEQMMPPMPPQEQMMPPQQESMMQSYPPSRPMISGDVITADQVEEIAESIIEEKWDELAKGVGKIVEWKERTEARINEMDARINQLQHILEDLHSAVLGKLNDYDRNMTSVGTDIKAMQRVFQQMLPAFTENVNELSRLTKSIKSREK